MTEAGGLKGELEHQAKAISAAARGKASWAFMAVLRGGFEMSVFMPGAAKTSHGSTAFAVWAGNGHRGVNPRWDRSVLRRFET